MDVVSSLKAENFSGELGRKLRLDNDILLDLRPINSEDTTESATLL